MRSRFALALACAAAPVTAADYVVIRHDLIVERPADAVWKRVGDYCALREWMGVSCDYASGAGDVGTVRRLRDGATLEPMVARTAHSYTYTQTVGNMAGKEYHGTLAVEPVDARRSRLSYTLFYDAAAMPSDAVRASEYHRLDSRFAELLGVMKRLAEGK